MPTKTLRSFITGPIEINGTLEAFDGNVWHKLSGFSLVEENDVNMPEIDKVIFNPPATIVFFDDGSKTVVRCSPNDVFDREKGIALCVMKRAYGNTGRFNDIMRDNMTDLLVGVNK